MAGTRDFERASPARRDDLRRDRTRMEGLPSHRRLPLGRHLRAVVTREDAKLDLLSFAWLD
jgi:hypothetical protein